MEFERLKEQIMKDAETRVETARHDYKCGMRDCKAGIFDKWFRYNHADNGRAYEIGWMEQNEETNNEHVQFIGGE